MVNHKAVVQLSLIKFDVDSITINQFLHIGTIKIFPFSGILVNKVGGFKFYQPNSNITILLSLKNISVYLINI